MFYAINGRILSRARPHRDLYFASNFLDLLDLLEAALIVFATSVGCHLSVHIQPHMYMLYREVPSTRCTRFHKRLLNIREHAFRRPLAKPGPFRSFTTFHVETSINSPALSKSLTTWKETQNKKRAQKGCRSSKVSAEADLVLNQTSSQGSCEGERRVLSHE